MCISDDGLEVWYEGPTRRRNDYYQGFNTSHKGLQPIETVYTNFRSVRSSQELHYGEAYNPTNYIALPCRPLKWAGPKETNSLEFPRKKTTCNS